MALNVNCDGFQRDRYFSRSWALITQDDGWVKPILLLTLAQLIPIIGPLGVSGYIVEWARLVAWNTNAAPKQQNVNIGECIVSGWRSFLVCLGWGILFFLALGLIVLVPIVGALLMMAAIVFAFYLEQLLRVAVLRASIYQQLGAGYKASRIWEMGERDVDGLMHVVGISFIGNLIIGTVVSVVGSIVLIAVIPAFIDMVMELDAMTYVNTAEEMVDILQSIFGVFLSFAPTYIVVGLIATLLSTLLNFILMGAVALWMRQFNVSAWGRSDDPLPQPLPETVFYYQDAPYAPGQAYSQYGQAYVQQQTYDPGYGQAYVQQQTYDPGYGQANAQQQTYDPGYGQAFTQAFEQAYNEAYAQAYGTAPETIPEPVADEPYVAQQAESAPELQYVLEAEPVPEADPVPEPETAPYFEPAPEAEPPFGTE